MVAAGHGLALRGGHWARHGSARWLLVRGSWKRSRQGSVSEQSCLWRALDIVSVTPALGSVRWGPGSAHSAGQRAALQRGPRQSRRARNPRALGSSARRAAVRSRAKDAARRRAGPNQDGAAAPPCLQRAPAPIPIARAGRQALRLPGAGQPRLCPAQVLPAGPAAQPARREHQPSAGQREVKPARSRQWDHQLPENGSVSANTCRVTSGAGK